MKQVFLILAFVLISVYSWAQETNRNQFSSAPETARYQIVQSELAAKVTLKIDKYTGKVFQLVEGESGLTWQLLFAETHPHDKTTTLEKVNYQVFTSGLATRMTFLLNVNTGATWQLAKDSKIGLFWDTLE
jgi:hypothetical protein